jgi:hypothetical protein
VLLGLNLGGFVASRPLHCNIPIPFPFLPFSLHVLGAVVAAVVARAARRVISLRSSYQRTASVLCRRTCVWNGEATCSGRDKKQGSEN